MQPDDVTGTEEVSIAHTETEATPAETQATPAAQTVTTEATPAKEASDTQTEKKAETGASEPASGSHAICNDVQNELKAQGMGDVTVSIAKEDDTSLMLALTSQDVPLILQAASVVMHEAQAGKVWEYAGYGPDVENNTFHTYIKTTK